MTNTDVTFDQSCRFIIELGRIGHRYGVSSYRLTSYLEKVSKSLGIEGSFMITPSYINFVFETDGELGQQSRFEMMGPTTFEMTKLARISLLVRRVVDGSISLVEGEKQLGVIDRDSPAFGNLPVGIGYALSGAGFAVLMSVSWFDVFLAALLSLMVYAMVLSAGRGGWLAKNLEISCAFTASVAANIAAHLVPGSNAFMVTLCAVIVLIPGLALTLGLFELLGKHVISGMTRLVDGVMVTLKLFIGAAVGAALVGVLISVPPPVEPPAADPVWPWVFVPALMVGLALVFQIRPKDMGWTILGGLLAYIGIVLGSSAGYWQGSFVGALLLGIYANVFAWKLNRPTSVVMMAAIMVLVPGASAYRGLYALQTGGFASGVAAEWQVAVNVFAIIAGLLVAYSLVPPKVTL